MSKNIKENKVTKKQSPSASLGVAKATVISMTTDDYSALDARTHVYEKNGMYIGSDVSLERDDWIYDIEKKKMKLKTIYFTPGCERIFLEILSNAADHCCKSQLAGLSDCGKVEVTMDNQWISVKNYGIPIPIELVDDPDNLKGSKIYLPEMIFCRLRSSSHHKEKIRVGIGINGLGSKATNIFSIEFNIEVYNHVVGKKYTQMCRNNMLEINKPVIESYQGTQSSVKISYLADFKRFKLKGYNKEAIELFCRHACDISFTMKVPVIFNNLEFTYYDIRDYGRLYFGKDVDTAIVHRKYFDKKRKEAEYEYELMIVDTPDEGTHVSFVACMMTTEGGVHVNEAYRVLGMPILEMVNTPLERQLSKMKIEGKEKTNHLLKLQNIKKHVSIILSCRLDNPEFQDQRKAYLTKPIPKIEIPEKLLEPISEWQLVSRLNHDLKAKQNFQLAKTDGKQSWFLGDIDIKGFRDAGDAGYKNKSQNCTLMFCEGKSAANYLLSYISSIEEGHRYYGILPLRGKCLNTQTADEKRIEKNKEIRAIKKVLGLKEGIDYSIKENFNQLRYGKIMLVTDADLDGKHINGLFTNILFCRFNSLLKISGFITYKRTPIVKASKGKQHLNFYTEQDYNIWFEKQKFDYNKEYGKWYEKHTKNSGFHGWSINYYKGLATSNDKEILEDRKEEKILNYIYDDKAEHYLNLVFNKDNRDARKKWILNWEEHQHFIDVSMKYQPISDFINNEFIHFSRQSNIRAIPKLMDGLKESQRKVLTGAYRYFKIAIDKKYEKYKVVDLDSFTSSETIYHHGNEILSKVIILMAQDFVGSNNINLFQPDGQYGCRYDNGKYPGSPRYIHTYPTDIVPYIFVDDDKDLLRAIIEEGKAIEPEFFLPIIPYVLVNGSQGMGSGFSTNIPAHDPLVIIQWLKLRLMGKTDLPTLKPYYRGFNGEITVIDRSKNSQDTDMEEDEIQDFVHKHHVSEEENEDIDDLTPPLIKPLLSFVTTGVYRVEKDIIIVTELPISLSPEKYIKSYLNKWMEEKKIKKYENMCDKHNIRFEIKGFEGQVSYKNLALRRQFNLCNMVLLDHNNNPARYETAADIMETFYNLRLPYYNKRKENKLSYIQLNMEKLKIEIKFIEAIIGKIIVVQNTPKVTILEKMRELGLPDHLYTNAKLSDINKDSVSSLLLKIKQLENEYGKLSKQSAQDLWLIDLKNLETKYKSIYKI